MSGRPEYASRLLAAIAAAEPQLRAMSEQASATRPGPGRWSPREILGHLIDSASNNHHRFVHATWKSDLVFPGYEQEAWVEAQHYQDVPWLDLIGLWTSFNRHLAHVMTVVPEQVRSRVHAVHNLPDIAFLAPSTAADATLAYFMADYVDHLEHHLRQVLGTAWRKED